MRQLWLRPRRAQVRLFVAAVSATILVVFGDSFAAEGRSPLTTHASNLSPAASGRCSKATAARVAARFHVGVDASTGRTPIAQVLCGPFFGPGSRGMVASVAIPSCGGSIGWAVFRVTGGRWRLVMKRPHGAALEAVGSDIRETQGVLRGNDAHCFPSATRSRIWHWTGTRFRASRWKVTLASLQHLHDFLSPDRRVWCSISGLGGEIFCGTGLSDEPSDPNHPDEPGRLATLSSNGTVTICSFPVDMGGCLQNWDWHSPVLHYGQRNEFDDFRCTSETIGITCTLLASSGSGKGFLINSTSAQSLGP